MKKYNFDIEVNRLGTDCMKVDSLMAYYKRDDLIPMWVADMDLKCCDEIIDALKTRAEHGIFGYGVKKDSYYTAIMGWYERRHQTTLVKEWISYIPNVVTGLRMVTAQFTQVGENITIISPVYGPFKKSITDLGRNVLESPLINKDGIYFIDFENLEDCLKQSKVLFFCSPHNPVGRIWAEDEMIKVSALCLKHNVLLVSDEIHCDLVQKPHKFKPMVSLCEKTQNNTITFISVSKTFNCAGLMGATAIIPNPEIRNSFRNFIFDYGLYMTNVFTVAGVKAAYTHGDQWVDEVVEYIGENYKYVSDYLKQNLPFITHSPLEGSYLMWIDCREIASSDQELNTIMENYCGIAGEPGGMFGDDGIGFYRLNLATRHVVVEKTMDNMKKGIEKYLQEKKV